MGSPRGAHCGPRSPPRGTICSLSMHHLLVWAVAGATWGGGLRSVCVSVGAAEAGAGRSSAAPGLGLSAWRRGPVTTVAGSAVRRCPSGLAKTAEPPSLAEVAGVPRRSKQQKIPPFEPTQRARTVTLASTWSFWGHVPGRASAASCRETDLPNRVPGTTLSNAPATPF